MADKITLHVYDDSDSQYKDMEFDEDSILTFGVRNKDIYYKNGNFHTFYKYGFILIGTEAGPRQYIIFYDKVKMLKERFKGRYTTDKNVKEKHSKRGNRYTLKRGINWTYIVKQVIISRIPKED